MGDMPPAPSVRALLSVPPSAPRIALPFLLAVPAAAAIFAALRLKWFAVLCLAAGALPAQGVVRAALTISRGVTITAAQG